MLSMIFLVSIVVLLIFVGGCMYLIGHEFGHRHERKLHTQAQERFLGQQSTRRAKPEVGTLNKPALQYVDRISSALDSVFQMLPAVPEVKELYSSMSPELRQQLAVPLGIEFQHGAAQLTATELEAIAKLQEKTLNVALYLKKVKLAAISTPQAFIAKLEALLEIQKTYEEYQGKLTNPKFQLAYAMLVGSEIGDFLREVRKGQGSVSPEIIAVFASHILKDTQDEHQLPQWVDPTGEFCPAALRETLQRIYETSYGNGNGNNGNGYLPRK